MNCQLETAHSQEGGLPKGKNTGVGNYAQEQREECPSLRPLEKLMHIFKHFFLNFDLKEL